MSEKVTVTMTRDDLEELTTATLCMCEQINSLEWPDTIICKKVRDTLIDKWRTIHSKLYRQLQEIDKEN